MTDVSIPSKSLTIQQVVVCRPGHPGSDVEFLNKFELFLMSLSLKHGRFLICGNFNCWVDVPTAKPYSAEFIHNYVFIIITYTVYVYIYVCVCANEMYFKGLIPVMSGRTLGQAYCTK